jgi:hypothetical protein
VLHGFIAQNYLPRMGLNNSFQSKKYENQIGNVPLRGGSYARLHLLQQGSYTGSLSDGQRGDTRIFLEKVIEIGRIFKTQAECYRRYAPVRMLQ